MTTNSYDEVPYASYPYPQTHPDRLATIATLLGLQPAGLSNCRVLELGCCSGGNLIPMACRMPGAEFVGIDASARQIADGQAVVSQLGLTNIRLIHRDIMEIGPADGLFDYIITHGVYSWVPPQVQDKILSVCHDNLSPHGVAYVSYNVLPGWRMRGIIRDIMLFRARCAKIPADRIDRARSLVGFLARSVSQENNPYGLLLRKELDQLQGKDDAYLLHEYLEDHNEGLYFYQFMERAAGKGLQYLGEADFGSMSLQNMPEQVETVLQTVTNDVIELEQYKDFVRNRMFRQTLLCHGDARIDRTVSPGRLGRLFVSSPVRPESPIQDVATADKVTFKGPTAVTTTTNPLMKMALMLLGERWPLSVQFSELLGMARSRLRPGPVVVGTQGMDGEGRRLAESMLQGYAMGQIHLSTLPSAFTLQAGPRPAVCPLARLQSTQGNMVTNLKHELVPLDELERNLLRQLDGQKTLPDIAAALTETVLAGELVIRDQDQPVQDPQAIRQILSKLLEPSLASLAARAMILSVP